MWEKKIVNSSSSFFFTLNINVSLGLLCSYCSFSSCCFLIKAFPLKLDSWFPQRVIEQQHQNSCTSSKWRHATYIKLTLLVCTQPLTSLLLCYETLWCCSNTLHNISGDKDDYTVNLLDSSPNSQIFQQIGFTEMFKFRVGPGKLKTSLKVRQKSLNWIYQFCLQLCGTKSGRNSVHLPEEQVYRASL